MSQNPEVKLARNTLLKRIWHIWTVKLCNSNMQCSSGFSARGGGAAPTAPSGYATWNRLGCHQQLWSYHHMVLVVVVNNLINCIFSIIWSSHVQLIILGTQIHERICNKNNNIARLFWPVFYLHYLEKFNMWQVVYNLNNVSFQSCDMW